jgi:hypothetical protein
MNNFAYVVNNYIEVFDLKLPKDKENCDKVKKILLTFVKNLIFNVISIASIITFINNDSEIKSQTLKILIKYINEKCKATKKGGMNIMPSEFYGIDSGRYDSANFSGDILYVDPSQGIIRPQITGGGKKNNDKVDKNIIDEINQILKYYKLHVSSSIKKELLKIININLDCMFKQLKLKVKKSILTKDHIKDLIKQNKNLDIFK